MPTADKPKSFQEVILRLQTYWAAQGCAILQPYDMEVGAGTFHPATTLRALGPEAWAAARPRPRWAHDGPGGSCGSQLVWVFGLRRFSKKGPEGPLCESLLPGGHCPPCCLI